MHFTATTQTQTQAVCMHQLQIRKKCNDRHLWHYRIPRKISNQDSLSATSLYYKFSSHDTAVLSSADTKVSLSVCTLRLTSNGALLISQVCAGINLKFVYEGTRFILLMGVNILQLLFFLTVMFSLSFDIYFYSLSKKAICDAVTYCRSQQYLNAD